MRETIKKLAQYAETRHIDISDAFGRMLDFFIGTFDVGRLIDQRFNMPAIFEKRRIDDPELAELQERWIRITCKEIDKNGAYDFFGTMYEEMVQGKFKAAAMGQFFTPMSLCMAMADAVGAGNGVIEDSACGSGRTLLAHWAKADRTKHFYYKGADLDPVSVKMCTLNMTINGMTGIVTHANSLTGEVFGCYVVNEVKYPLPCPACSIRCVFRNK